MQSYNQHLQMHPSLSDIFCQCQQGVKEGKVFKFYFYAFLDSHMGQQGKNRQVYLLQDVSELCWLLQIHMLVAASRDVGTGRSDSA